jgi:hypothetical protein
MGYSAVKGRPSQDKVRAQYGPSVDDPAQPGKQPETTRTGLRRVQCRLW